MKNLLSLLFLFFFNISFASVSTDLSAPSFELVDSYGENISLSNFKGNTVVLNGQTMIVHMLLNTTQQEICKTHKNKLKKKELFG